MTDVRSNDGPVFVIGSMRSGTTLLRLILDSHDRIAIGPETGFMRAVAATKMIPQWRYGGEWYARIGWSEEELEARLRDFYAGMFERYAQSQGKVRWGDKTPFHTAHIEQMSRVFPDASFVAIVRHPGAVAQSLVKNFHYSVSDAVGYWVRANTALLRGAESVGDRLVLCRYEDLVAAPEEVTRSLIAWLGEQWSPRLLQHEQVQRSQGAPRVVDGSTSSRDPIDPDRVARWTELVTPELLQELAEVAGPLARYFGYSTSNPAVTSVLAGDDAVHPLISGSGLMARRRRGHDVCLELPPDEVPVGADVEDLARRVVRAEAALARVRSRRAVQVADSVQRAVRGRAPRELVTAYRALRPRR